MGISAAAMPALRNYGNSYDDLADPTKPIKRLVHVEPEPTKPKYEPPVTSKRPSRSRSTLSTKSNAYKTEAIEFESSKDRKITQMKKDVNVMSNQNKTLRGDNKNRMRTIKALEKLMDKEKDALGQVLEAARQKLYRLEDENAGLQDMADVERDHRLHVQEEMAALEVNNHTQIQVLDKHVADLTSRARDATAEIGLVIQKGDHERAAQKVHFESIMASLRDQMSAAESRFQAEKSALTMANSRLRSLMRIWQEIIVDLQFQIRQKTAWCWGFKLWHWNVIGNSSSNMKRRNHTNHTYLITNLKSTILITARLMSMQWLKVLDCRVVCLNS